MTIYRKIWTEHFGPIPKDEDGRSYEIHHIDGDHSNNDITNLKCVSIQEHYQIHYSQGDWGACRLLARSMKMSPEYISQLTKKQQKERIDNGTHHFLDSSFQREMSLRNTFENRSRVNSKTAKKRIENGTNPIVNSEYQKTLQRKKVEEGTHHLLGGDIQRKTNNRRVTLGTHHLLGPASNQKMIAEGKHPTQKIHTCPHCGKVGKGGAMKLWHFDNCRLKL